MWAGTRCVSHDGFRIGVYCLRLVSLIKMLQKLIQCVSSVYGTLLLFMDRRHAARVAAWSGFLMRCVWKHDGTWDVGVLWTFGWSLFPRHTRFPLCPFPLVLVRLEPLLVEHRRRLGRGQCCQLWILPAEDDSLGFWVLFIFVSAEEDPGLFHGAGKFFQRTFEEAVQLGEAPVRVCA